MVHSLSHAAEFFPIVTGITLRIGEPTISNKCVCFVTDNAAQDEAINQQTSKHNHIILLVRDFP